MVQVSYSLLITIFNLIMTFQLYLCQHHPQQDAREFALINNKTYFIDFHQVTKPEALSKCAELNMSLVSFEEQQEYSDVLDYVGNNGYSWNAFWTSGERMKDSTVWTWGPNGSEISYAEWVDGEPSCEITEEACQYFMMAFGGWYDDLCTPDMYTSGVMCE